MTGFRRTDGTLGCPPTETPPSDYRNPFFVDGSGALWVSSCFKDLRYLGAARHDITSPILIGGPSGSGQVSSFSDITTAGKGIAGGKYKSVTVTNTNTCPMGILLGHDSGVDITTRGSNMVKWTVAAYWNGAYHSSSSSTSMWLGGTLSAFAMITQKLWASANPHDAGIEATGTPSLVIQPGDSAVVSARMYVSYDIGAADGTETVNSGISAIRVYGYNIE